MEHVARTIKDLEGKLVEAENRVATLKTTINSLCALSGEPPRYAETRGDTAPSIGNLRPDQFYGLGLSTAVREILEIRQAANLGSATLNELHDALVAGGYAFSTKNVANAKRGLRISLTKNSHTFHKLPGGTFGLKAWYPAIGEPRTAAHEEPNGQTERDDGVDEQADEPTTPQE